jgi:methylamine utilization protein MauE
MVAVAASLVLGVVLLAAAGLKAAGGPGARAALATYGLEDPRAARWAWGALIAAEAVLGVAVAAGSTAAAYAGGAFMAAACAVQAAALAAGRGGAPCGCFGARGRLGRASVGRAAALAAGLAVLPQLPRAHVTTDGWLAAGLAAALLAVAALGIAVLALAREVGMLRLAVGPQGALEVAEEGPPVGERSALAGAFGPPAPGRLALAVFTSEGCGMCRALAPVVAAFGRDPRLAVRTFDEARDAPAWALAGVPGSPYAVVLDADGTVLAKGTFNTGAQLESVLAAAERRRAQPRAGRPAEARA